MLDTRHSSLPFLHTLYIVFFFKYYHSLPTYLSANLTPFFSFSYILFNVFIHFILVPSPISLLFLIQFIPANFQEKKLVRILSNAGDNLGCHWPKLNFLSHQGLPTFFKASLFFFLFLRFLSHWLEVIV